MQVRFTQNQLTELFKASASKLFQKDVNSILDGVSEPMLCSRMAIYMENLFPDYKIEGNYYADTEFNRKQNGKVKTIIDDQMQVIRIKCDLLLHSRGEEVPDNLITVEMKKSSRPAFHKAADRKRLRAMTKKQDVYSTDGTTHPEHVCGYIIGIYMEIDKSKRTCLFEKYKGGDMIESWSLTF
ncbi:hypothetical protein [Pedobacter soli]|uniref:PD-(D/E)XK nuclease superfamily protein n=1 Tax=Pedobacter soli TaxID=390242 RepID=A0A1G7ASY6_9SPHI|nr:hypothetical protein [Pedobacter soli]SDE17913.1 hypothetical protein SAMN04488024_11343 [Pedobacter soli]